MQQLRRLDGVWDLDEPFNNNEVDLFRVFMLWKVAGWQDLTQERPTAAFRPSFGPNTRIIDHTSINAAGRDARRFQPYLRHRLQRKRRIRRELKSRQRIRDRRVIGKRK